MDLRIFTEPQQGATYDDLLRLAKASEELGFSAFFRSDHYLAMGTSGLPGPSDAWITLAGLARETSTIRLGTLVTSATFRFAGPTAIAVANVDQMSGGRVDFGLGAGWFAEEHSAYGIPFPSVSDRFDLLEDSLAVITGLWSTPEGETFSYQGSAVSVTDSPALAKPVQRDPISGGPPVLIGGAGKRRTPALTARYAAEFNTPFLSIDKAAIQFQRVDAAAEEIGRDPRSIVHSAALTVAVGESESQFRVRVAAIGRDSQELQESGLAGTTDQVVDRIGQWQEQTGVTRIYLQVLDLSDLDHLELIASKVAPQLS